MPQRQRQQGVDTGGADTASQSKVHAVAARQNGLWLFLKGAFARSPHDRSPIINNSLQQGVLGGICGPNRCACPRSSFSEAGAAAAAMRSSCQ